MNPSRILLVAALWFSVAASNAQAAEAPEPALEAEAIATRFQVAWNRHDMDALSALMAEDVVFVNVGALRLDGREEFRKFHADLHETVMAGSVLSTRSVDARLIRPDVAIVHWDWSLQGDRNRDGESRPPREGTFILVLEYRDGRWRIAAAQNTNRSPPPG